MLTRRTFGAGLGGLAYTTAAGCVTTSRPPTAASVEAQGLVDPELRSAHAAYLRAIGTSDLTIETLAALRQRNLAATRLPLPTTDVTETTVPGLNGAPDVRLFVINKSPGQNKPAVLHIHGGGYISGSAKGAIRGGQELAVAHDCVVVTVDYRLAPETLFPGPRDDCYAALVWLHRNAGTLGVDSSRVAVKGESAGGGLAAMVALASRDRGDAPICAQILIYPMLDDRTIRASRNLPYTFTAQANEFGWTSLLGKPAGSKAVPAGAVPARAASVAGLPQTFIGVGQIDLFLDEDVIYAQRLIAANVPTELLVVPGAFHAFDAVAPQASISRSFTSGWSDALARAFRLG